MWNKFCKWKDPILKDIILAHNILVANLIEREKSETKAKMKVYGPILGIKLIELKEGKIQAFVKTVINLLIP
jgi:hypothetical protein